MPYPFVLPTTSAFSFSSSFSCESHPSLPLNASTHRGVVRDTLKTHKRLPPSSQAPNLSSVASSLATYLPYLLAIEAGLGRKDINGREVTVSQKSTPTIEWRPTLSDYNVPGKEPARAKIHSLAHEISLALSTLANTYTLQARLSLHPLYITSAAPPTPQQRQTAITNAIRLLLDAASIHDHLSHLSADRPAQVSPDISPSTIRAQRALALAEATLLAVLKDDPYPAAAAADRNAHDNEWMYKAPEIPRVRAHLFARLCLAAAEHAARAHSLCAHQGGGREGRVGGEFVAYLEDLRRTSRAKACRLFGIDAELGGQTGAAIGWLRAAMGELGVEVGKEGRKSGMGGLGRLRKEWSEKREDRKVEKGVNWGADAGRLEEMRVVEMLEAKWTKQNDTMFTQPIPSAGSLLAQMPSGREIHSIKPFQPPTLDGATLEAMKAPPDMSDEAVGGASSDEETLVDVPVGAFPGTQGEYRAGTPNYF